MAVVLANSSGQHDRTIGRPGQKALPGAIALALLALVAGLLVGVSATGDNLLGLGPKFAVLVVAGFGAILLFILGIKRMELFVLVLLAIRSSLDVSRLNGDAQSQSIANPSSLVALMFLGMGLTWIFVRRSTGVRHPTSFLQRALILFLVAAGLNVIGSADPMVSGLEFLRTAAAIVMFFVVDRLARGDGPPRPHPEGRLRLGHRARAPGARRPVPRPAPRRDEGPGRPASPPRSWAPTRSPTTSPSSG